VYIEYRLRNPIEKISPSSALHNLKYYFKVIFTKQNQYHYTNKFYSYQTQPGDIIDGRAVTRAELDLNQRSRNDLESNRHCAWASSVEDEMLATLRDTPYAIAYDKGILHLSQETNNM